MPKFRLIWNASGRKREAEHSVSVSGQATVMGPRASDSLTDSLKGSQL